MRSTNSAYFAALQLDVVELVELIELTSKTQTFRWAGHDRTIVNSGNSYDPFPGFTPSGIDDGSDMGVSVIDFVLANSNYYFDDLIKGNNLDFGNVSIRRVFVNSPDMGQMYIFEGKIGDYTYNRDLITGQARNQFGSIERQWPYYSYNDQCVWRFGGPGCSFDTSSITISSLTVGSAASKIDVYASSLFISSGYADGHFNKGRLTFTAGVNSGEVRMVRAHTGDLLQLSHKVPYDISAGDLFSLYRGCLKRVEQDCTSLFNNTSSFLGFPWIPRQENAL